MRDRRRPRAGLWKTRLEQIEAESALVADAFNELGFASNLMRHAVVRASVRQRYSYKSRPFRNE